MKKRVIFLLGILLTAAVSVLVLHEVEVHALSGANWQAGNIVGDAIFTNANSMSVQQIQDFIDGQINAKGGCDTWGTQTATDWGSTLSHAAYAQSRGWPAPPYVCLNQYYEVPKTSPSATVPDNSYNHYDSASRTLLTVPSGISAAQIIYNAAQQYQISPMVLLVKVQTESAGPLTQDTWPLPSQYTYAMGSHCPDSGPGGSANCDSTYSGFSIQMYSAANLLRYYLDNMRQPWWPYKTPFATNSVLWNVSTTGCGAGDVYIATKATAALYTYTPYQPNSAALANVSSVSSGGLGDGCSAYGNRNFWWWFSHWFGSPNYVAPTCDSKLANVGCVWQLEGPNDSNFLTSNDTERDTAVNSSRYSYDSSPFYAFTSAQTNTIPIYRIRLANEHFYTASSVEKDSLLQNPQNLYEGIAFYVYPASINTNSSYPIYRLTSAYGHAFVSTIAERDYLISEGFTYEGIAFNAPSGYVSISDPTPNYLHVYRLSNASRHIYTTSISERDTLLKSGWAYEGTLFDTAAAATATPVYRLTKSGDHIFTTSYTENQQLISIGWVYEGIAWYNDTTTAQTYRFYINGKHFYTADLIEAFSLSNASAQYEGTAFGYDQSVNIPIYRLYNGKYHFFTADVNEALSISNKPWKFEGIGWYGSPSTTSTPVYRLYNGTQHIFTASNAEKSQLIGLGWKFEGIGWYGSPSTTSTPVYRLYNGTHFFTISDMEKNQLQAADWNFEGVAWYAY